MWVWRFSTGELHADSSANHDGLRWSSEAVPLLNSVGTSDRGNGELSSRIQVVGPFVMFVDFQVGAHEEVEQTFRRDVQPLYAGLEGVKVGEGITRMHKGFVVPEVMACLRVEEPMRSPFSAFRPGARVSSWTWYRGSVCGPSFEKI